VRLHLHSCHHLRQQLQLPLLLHCQDVAHVLHHPQLLLSLRAAPVAAVHSVLLTGLQRCALCASPQVQHQRLQRRGAVGLVALLPAAAWAGLAAAAAVSPAAAAAGENHASCCGHLMPALLLLLLRLPPVHCPAAADAVQRTAVAVTCHARLSWGLLLQEESAAAAVLPSCTCWDLRYLLKQC
jgi:hypothetical protein